MEPRCIAWGGGQAQSFARKGPGLLKANLEHTQSTEAVTNGLTIALCTKVSSHGSGSSPPPLNSLPSPFPTVSGPRHLRLSMVAKLTNLIAHGFKFFRVEQQKDGPSSLLPILMTSYSIALLLHYDSSCRLHQKKG